MLRFILYLLLIWFLYNLIFRFIIPVSRTSRQMRQKFREMNQNMQDEMNRQQNFSQQAPPKKQETEKPAGDYIDFEEIK